MARHFTILAFIVASLCTGMAHGQLILEKTHHDFGVLARADDRFADFTITNQGSKTEILFRVEVAKNVDVKMTSKSLGPGKSETIRLHYNPSEAGLFDLEAKVFASAWNQPKVLRLTGEATFAEADVPCPDFNTAPSGLVRNYHVSVRDAEMKPVAGASVTVYQNGRPVDELLTDMYGEVSHSLKPGRYFMVASWKGVGVDTAVYTSSTQDHLLLLLPIGLGIQKDEMAENIEPLSVAALESEQLQMEVPQEKTAVKTTAQNLKGDSERMPLSMYKQNNVVFLVDVSTSMKHNGKLDLLKIAMTDLIAVLRDADRFTLISYASDTRVLFEASQNLDRQACAAAIADLQAGGSTEGAKGIDKAGRTALSHFLNDGNNQIVLATDGAFNQGASQAQKLVNKYQRRGVNTSVLCIRCGSFTTKEMKGLATMGNGRFVPLESPSEAGERLIDEIKRSALR